jgi:hypothetical protein
VKRVNKTCSDNVIYNEVESVGLPCFDGCKDSGVGPKRNSSDPCWIGCFYDTGAFVSLTHFFSLSASAALTACWVRRIGAAVLTLDVDVFVRAVLGPDAGTPGGTIAGMPLSDLLVAWNLPFATTDPTKKGCPALKP